MIRKLILLTCLSFSLPGCAQMLISKFVDGSSPCPATEVNKVMQSSRMLYQVRTGQSVTFVTGTSFMGAPHHQHKLQLVDGSSVNVLFYKVGLPETCSGAEKYQHQYEPVFTENNRVVGLGYEYYRRDIAPYVPRTTSVANTRVKQARYVY